jgi:hypothetical protein
VPPENPDLSPETLLEEMAEAPAPRHQITKVRYTHDAMIDLLVANPRVSQNELAAHFGYTPAWVSTVMATDLFKERLEHRRTELVDPEVKASVNERFHAVVTKSLQVLQAKLSKPIDQIPDNLALRAAELGAKGIGAGGFGGGMVFNLPSPATDSLEKLASRLMEFQGAARRTGNIEDAVVVKDA